MWVGWWGKGILLPNTGSGSIVVFTQIKCDSWLSSLHHHFPNENWSPVPVIILSPSLLLLQHHLHHPPPPSLTFSGKLFIMSTKAFLVMKWSWSLYFLALYFVGKGSVPPRENVLTLSFLPSHHLALHPPSPSPPPSQPTPI